MGKEFENQGRPKHSHVMPALVKDHEVIQNSEIIDEGFVNFIYLQIVIQFHMKKQQPMQSVFKQ